MTHRRLHPVLATVSMLAAALSLACAGGSIPDVPGAGPQEGQSGAPGRAPSPQCSTQPSSGDDVGIYEACPPEEPPCVGDDCESECEGDCSPCASGHCEPPPPCDGDCEPPPCDGNDCEPPPCDGNDCEPPPCDGDDCEPPAVAACRAIETLPVCDPQLIAIDAEVTLEALLRALAIELWAETHADLFVEAAFVEVALCLDGEVYGSVPVDEHGHGRWILPDGADALASLSLRLVVIIENDITCRQAGVLDLAALIDAILSLDLL